MHLNPAPLCLYVVAPRLTPSVTCFLGRVFLEIYHAHARRVPGSPGIGYALSDRELSVFLVLCLHWERGLLARSKLDRRA